jgi:hypothetical protein
MRVTIKGLTDSTITFNTIGIIVRGNSAKPELYPNSVAKHIVIDTNNDAQMRELITLKNAKLISVINEDAVQETPVVKAVPVSIPAPVVPVAPVNKPEPPRDEVEETTEEDDEEVLTVWKKDGSKRTPKTGKASKGKKPSKITKVKRAKSSEPPPKEQEQEDSKIVVMTPNGPIEANAVNNMAGEMPESEATQASIEALKQLEAEEAVPDSLIDESKLDVSEQMGTQAIVATGENTVTKVSMKNSILPEANAIKERGIKFINPDGSGEEVDPNAVDESVKDIFIDDDQDADPKEADDKDNDSFIEC